MAIDLQEFSPTLDQHSSPTGPVRAARFGLIALRQMEAKFEAVHAELAPQYSDERVGVRLMWDATRHRAAYATGV